MAAHSMILAQEIPLTEKPLGYSPWSPGVRQMTTHTLMAFP